MDRLALQSRSKVPSCSFFFSQPHYVALFQFEAIFNYRKTSARARKGKWDPRTILQLYFIPDILRCYRQWYVNIFADNFSRQLNQKLHLSLTLKRVFPFLCQCIINQRSSLSFGSLHSSLRSQMMNYFFIHKFLANKWKKTMGKVIEEA